MARNQIVILRTWEFGNVDEINASAIISSFRELVEVLDLPVVVYEDEVSGVKMLVISHAGSRGYMPVCHYVSMEGGSAAISVSVSGKGCQVRSEDLIQFQYKAKAALRDFMYGVHRGSSLAQRIGTGRTCGNIAGGIGAATGMAIKGTFKLAAKGVRVLMRDQQAYDEEMDFYKLALAVGDYILGGVDSLDIIDRLREKADAGNARAQFILGAAYAEGHGVDADEYEAMKWFERAASNGDLESRNIVAGEYLYSDKDYGTAKKQIGVQYLINLADSGEDWAPQQIIDIYWSGEIDGIPSDYEKAVGYARRYAEKGDMYSLLVLGGVCDTGSHTGIPELLKYKNDSRAVSFYNAVVNNSENKEYREMAALQLGRMSEEGRGREQSYEAAARYYGIAGALGNMEATSKLARYYTLGRGVAKDHRIAEDYCSQILRSGDRNLAHVAYYCMYRIEDERGKYKASMYNARKCLECAGCDEAERAEVCAYLKEQEELIRRMTDEERREYLQERKPLFKNLNKKILAIASVAAVAVIAVIVLLVFSPQDKGSETNSADSADSANLTASANSTVVLKAYSDLLSQDSINISEMYFWYEEDSDTEDELWQAKNCEFNIAYINDDDVPELILRDTADAGYENLVVLSYWEGYVSIAGSSDSGDNIAEYWGVEEGYYEKTGYYTSIYSDMGDGSYIITNIDNMDDDDDSISIEFSSDEIIGYYDSYEECSAEDFYTTLNNMVGNEELTPYEFYENTEKNRNKIFSETAAESAEPDESGDKITSGEEAVEYIIEMCNVQTGDTGDFENVKVSCWGETNGKYEVSIYNDMEDHISTIARYGVTREGYIYDMIAGEWVYNEDGWLRDL